MPEVQHASACFHCGQPVDEPGRWLAQVDGEPREMCCAGCQAVACAIVDAGLDDYYHRRSGPARGPDAVPAELAALGIYDEPEVQARYVRAAGDCRETTLLLEGLRCGACVWLIERTLGAQPGVVGASVNFATERAVLRWDPAHARLSELLTKISAIGYQALPYDPRQREAQLARVARSLLRRFFVAGIGMMQVMMYALPVYTAQAGEIEPQYENLLRWASMLLTAPVVLYSAQPFFAGALRDLRARSPGMDVPVALGIGAAFSASVWSTLTGRGEVWFDSVTMFVFLLLGARYLEWLARRRASRAIDRMSAALPERVRRLVAPPADQSEQSLATAPTEIVPAARLAPGDLLHIAIGERIAVDAEIVAGSTSIDQSLLTGESLPVARGRGDAVPGGAINSGNPVILRVLRASSESTLSTIERLIERASRDRPAIARLADRVASVFVVALLALAAVAFAAWWFVDPSRALPVAIAVLVVSCPCALSLATPAALAAASGAVTQRGLLLASGRALETIAVCTDVVFDKTGTLTVGRPRLTGVELAGADGREAALRLAAAIEAGSPHPLAAALRAAASDPEPPAAISTRTVPGCGVEATIEGRCLRLGARSWVSEWAEGTLPGAIGAMEPSAGSEVWLVERGRAIARFSFSDELRPDARETIAELRRAGMRVHVLSGDLPGAVAAVAREVGVEHWQAGASPTDKLEFVAALQHEGKRVLMVGDGINDAPVLAAADASVAVGDASALARTAADVVSLSPRLSAVAELARVARATRAVIAQNLWWATVYNLVAIPAAALGWVPPWLAAIGMSTSSLLVVGNALRLRVRGSAHART